MTPIEGNRKYPTRIHPAIDFVSEHAYVGQRICNGNPHSSDSLYILIDDKSILDFTDVTAEVNGISLRYTDFKEEPRWSCTGMDAFVNGTEPVQPMQLFERIKALFKAYIELSDQRLYDLLTLWSIGTYFCWLFNAYPYTYVGGISGNGKTKLMTLCSYICFNSVSTADVSPACLFRLIQSSRCSVFMDESEALSNKYVSPELRLLLLSGYKKGQRVYRSRRTEEGNFEPGSFEVYSPKMLVNIEGLEEVLGSRCINIIMQRGSNRNITAREVVFEYPVWQQIRDMVYPFLMKNWKAVKKTYNEVENDGTIQNRDWELWKPILALAHFFDNTTLFQSMKDLAVEKIAENQILNSNPYEIALAEALLFFVKNNGYYKLSDIKREMINRLEDHDYVSSRLLGNLLRRFGFTNNRRVGSGYEYFLEVSRIRTLARNLGISEGSECGEGATGQGNQNDQDQNQPDDSH